MKNKSTSIQFTSDFRKMINNLSLNSLGFFFLDFIIYFFTSQVLNASGFQVGLIFSLHIMGHIVSSTFTGYITDRVKSKKSLVLYGSIGRGVAYFVLYIALFLTNLIGIYIGYFLLGFFVGFFWIPFNTLIAQKSDKEVRSLAYGKREAAIGRGLMFGAITGFTLFNILINYTENPLIIYFIIPVFGIINFYAGFRFLRIVDESLIISEDTSNIYESKSKLSFSRSMILGFIFISIVLFLANLNGSLARPFLNYYLLEVITDNALLASFAYIPAGIISMFLAPKLGRIVDRIRPELSITFTSIIGAIVTWLLINTNNFLLFSVYLTLDVTLVQTANLVIQNIISRVSLKHRGKIFSSFQIFMNIGNLIGPMIGGLAFDFAITAPFIISIIVELSLIPFYIISIIIIKPFLRESYNEVELQK